jgi:hypothetical protein
MTTQAGGRAFRPTYTALEAAYPNAKVLSRSQLFEEMGIGELIPNGAYMNTCAIRMSYALAKAGVSLKKGGLRFNVGPHKGQRIEPGMKKLAEHLVELWGQPEKFDTDAAAQQHLGMRKGVVVFFFGDFLPLIGAQGHIDILKPRRSAYSECVGSCFFGKETKTWFWPLQ